MRTFFTLFVFSAVLALAGCNGQTATSTVQPFVATVSADVGQAEKVYAIAKGIALTAAVADPALASAVNAAIAKADPYAAALQAGTPVLAGIAVSAAGLVDQAAALEAATAKAIKVVPAAAS